MSLAGMKSLGHAYLFLAVWSRSLSLKLGSHTLGFRALMYWHLCVLCHTQPGGLMSLASESHLRWVGAVAGSQA